MDEEVTERKPAIAPHDIPLLLDRPWLKHNLRLGDSKIKELEDASILTPIEVPGISNKRYRAADVLPLLGYVPSSDTTTA